VANLKYTWAVMCTEAQGDTPPPTTTTLTTAITATTTTTVHPPPPTSPPPGTEYPPTHEYKQYSRTCVSGYNM
jgi:hypothetical protein